MKELDHFMNKDVYMDPELAFKTDYPYVEASESYGFAPFDRVFVFDNSNGRVNISSSQVYEMMARYIYLMVCGELTQDYNSIDNNLNPKIRGVNRVLNKPTCYSSFGYYSVVFPKSVAVQLAAADLALDVVEQELVTAAAERDLDKASDAFLTANKVHFSNQSPQILQSCRSTPTRPGTGSTSRTPSARRWPTSTSGASRRRATKRSFGSTTPGSPPPISLSSKPTRVERR